MPATAPWVAAAESSDEVESPLAPSRTPEAPAPAALVALFAASPTRLVPSAPADDALDTIELPPFPITLVPSDPIDEAPDTAVDAAPAAPLVMVEITFPLPSVTVEYKPAAPDVAVSKAPDAPETAVCPAPPTADVTVAAAPPRALVACLILLVVSVGCL
jgi:hypothetical protein